MKTKTFGNKIKYIISIAIIIVLSFSASAKNNSPIEDSAQLYYNKANYQNALYFYDSLYSQNYSSPELFLNMGNCYFQTGDIANSIYFYEKSISLDPSNAEAMHNLEIAKTKLESKVEELPVAFYKRWFLGAISIMSSDAWAITAIILFILGLISFAIYLFSNRLSLRKMGFISSIILVAIASLSIIFSTNLAKRITKNNCAIVFDKSLVKSSPNQESNNLFEVTPGLKVEITDSLNLWYNIKLSDGKQGWIESENVKRL
ncbi:MAG: tetratricopeptide repeat protein [Bacteroidales bacterium]|nr:tetratricopeptide repeat protein [Bacteroidales bacterium]